MPRRYDAAAVEVVVASEDRLGEGPYWCPETRSLLWCDILDNELHRFDPETRKHSTIRTAEKVHAIAAAAPPWFICTVHRHGLAWLNVETGELRGIEDPEAGKPDLLLNDGRCDGRGRFWFGSLQKKHENVGSLFEIGGDLRPNRHEAGFATANGIAFSPDQSTLYFADTYAGIFAFDYDLASGRTANRRLMFDAKANDKLADGLTIDDAGCLWVAMALAGEIVRLSPDGRIDAVVPIPSRFVTSCTFGGPGLDVLYVTTARSGRKPEELAREPLAGALFAAHVGCRGLAEVPFCGGSRAPGKD